jgi:hypothetical protein
MYEFYTARVELGRSNRIEGCPVFRPLQPRTPAFTRDLHRLERKLLNRLDGLGGTAPSLELQIL